MPTFETLPSVDEKLHTAKLIASSRITPPDSPEDVRQMTFTTDDAGFDARIGHCIKVMAPGQFGNLHHSRLYSLAHLEHIDSQGTEFSLLVRRCSYIDDFSGERYAGVASNYLCNLPLGSAITFSGPSGHPFTIPANHQSPLLMIGMGTGIAPFRGLVNRIYDTLGGWEGKVRLFYGARSGLEMLYMNDQNQDLANYFDQSTFKAFQAVSPRPHFDEPPAIELAIQQNAAEVREMLQDSNTQVFIAGPQAMLGRVEEAFAKIVAGRDAWAALHGDLLASGRWNTVLY
ncbi:FAD-binding oxidoreductase [Rhodoferax antarcticus]|uniref:Putative oxidoreductase FAD/NAD-binding domain protein n=1 Tax=Rhodoferax antarcticus ANT.BR TaxID=1111071 RepID=A0A1Q8YJ39_9BURK|nr:FAD-binding oxidoreductase [Rhodoferax antarcticus]APW48064.1 oxidoreductase [Rhodoferax antarcticus]MCW2313451.1 ferredoxin--NADP+ reductase [Rhodoferax antarcticus]OLP07910.1 putative oxidoreductase FAD/NAD-binding domain protein [Rhodoferax antarcticus ANT.BR]